jgi:RNA ligase (TIGR02306 family)
MLEIKEHTCDVVEIKLEPHSNADSLSLVMVGDFQCVVRTDDWKDGDLAVYIPPDSIVPDTEEFKFLGEHRRIKARRLRGEWSVGLLIPAPSGAKIGDDYMEQLGVVHYEPPICGDCNTGGENVRPPKLKETSTAGLHTPIYDVLNFRKYSRLFEEGEEVIVTEKLHGANARFVCVDDEIYCGSRRLWKKEDPNNLWWKALKNCPVLESWLRHNQNLPVYAEVYGQVQNLKYGAMKGEVRIAAFDILKGYNWLDFDDAHAVGAPLPWVPLVYRGPFNKDMILELAEGDSSIPEAKHYREGVVVKPVHERVDRRIGRVQLKVVGNRYLSKS